MNSMPCQRYRRRSVSDAMRTWIRPSVMIAPISRPLEANSLTALGAAGAERSAQLAIGAGFPDRRGRSNRCAVFDRPKPRPRRSRAFLHLLQ